MKYVTALVHEEAGSFGISFPDFPGCVSTAGSIDDAILRGEQALRLHIEGMVEDGEMMPVLRTPSEIREAGGAELDGATFVAVAAEPQDNAVRVNITIEAGLLQAIDRAAQSAGTSRSAFLAKAARDSIIGTRN